MGDVPTPRLSGVASFITLLRVAADNATLRATLDKILSQPPEQRQGILYFLIQDMRFEGAPADIIAAFTCLQDDAVADKARIAIAPCASEPSAVAQVNPGIDS
jgi:hypothetical protein